MSTLTTEELLVASVNRAIERINELEKQVAQLKTWVIKDGVRLQQQVQKLDQRTEGSIRLR